MAAGATWRAISAAAATAASTAPFPRTCSASTSSISRPSAIGPTSSVPVSAVREFAGSLDGRKARKGVFVTTATFPRSAASFVSAVPSKIVLIDGPALADLLIGYNIGVKVRETYEVKQIDEAYLAAALHRASPMQGDPGRRWRACFGRPIELHYWPTPNGWKITIMLEECGLAL
jgi:hypothetical protein